MSCASIAAKTSECEDKKTALAGNPLPWQVIVTSENLFLIVDMVLVKVSSGEGTTDFLTPDILFCSKESFKKF